MLIAITKATGTDTVIPSDIQVLSDYDFDGWDYEGTTLHAGDIVPTQLLNTVVSLKARWTQQTYTVHFAENKPVGVTAAISGMPSDIVNPAGTDTTLPANIPALAGYMTSMVGISTELSMLREQRFPARPLTLRQSLRLAGKHKLLPLLRHRQPRHLHPQQQFPHQPRHPQ